MNSFIKVALFFLCNFIGTIVIAIFYNMTIIKIDTNSETFSIGNFIYTMMFTPFLLWAICAVFSFSIFFVSKQWRIFFLAAPIIVPTIACLAAMFKFT